MKLIYYILFLLLFFSATESSGQAFVNQGCYWPRYAPNGIDRTSKDSTSEDWWFDFKTVPAAHPAYDTGGRYICVGYSGFDDVGVGNLYPEPFPNFVLSENPFTAISPENFDLPDMRHMNTSGTIGLVNLTRTSSSANPEVWTYHYGKGLTFTKVIPTSDGGFLATGTTTRFNIPYVPGGGPQPEVQFADFLANAPPGAGNPSLIYYQAPSSVTGMAFDKNPFLFSNTLAVPPYSTDPDGLVFKSHACLAKVNASGILQWFYTYGIVPHDRIDGEQAYKNSTLGTDLVEVDSGYVLAGVLQNSPVNGTQANRPFLLQTDRNGDLKWIRQYVDLTYKSEKFTAIKLRSATELYVTSEGTHYIGISCSSPHSPTNSVCINGASTAILEHHNILPCVSSLKKIDLSTGNQIWNLLLTTDTTVNSKVRSLDIDANDKILVPVSGQCYLTNSYTAGECKVSYVNKVTDLGASATIDQTISFGSMRAYDLSTSLGVKATTDGGFVVVGTKKAYNLNINKRYDLSPFGNGFNMTGFAQAFSQTDAYVAKCNSTGNIEWANIFDNKVQSGNGSILSNAGNPRDQANLDSWMNYTLTRSKKDIKRQECLYAIETSTTGEIIVGGNMSSNIDDGYLAMVENTCDLTLSNYLIQSIPSFAATPMPVTNMNNFVGSNINTGRVPGNMNDVAEFIVNKGAVVTMEAGQEINMYEGTDLNVDLDSLADIDVYINPSHTCTAGAVYSYNYSPSSFRKDKIVNKKESLPRNVRSSITASPNPTTGMVMIKHPAGIKQLAVFDLYGKAVLNIRANSSGQTGVDFGNMPAGMYLIKLDSIKDMIKIIKN